MKLVDIDIGASPERAGHARLSGIVRYDDPRGGPAEEVFWFEVPEEFAPDLTRTGNPWLAMLLPIAVVSGERLVVSRPVDALFLDNAHDLMKTWRYLHPDDPAVTIEADLEAATTRPAGTRAAAFFSGGVDSFQTALRPRAAPLDDLLIALGSFDMVEGDPASFARIEARMRRAADRLGKTLVPVTTNQMRTSRMTSSLALRASHSLLASIALAIEGRYARVLYSSWTDHRWYALDGDYTLLAQLLSTSRTRFENEGASLSRVDKIAEIAGSDVVREALRVCYQSGHENNCMACAKCMRTAVALEALGGLERWPTFGGKALPAARARRTTISLKIERYYWEELPPFCREHGREDLARAAEHVLLRARMLDPFRPLVRWLRRRPAIARWTHRAEAMMQDVDPLSLRRS
jgi:hypothetical protein